MRESKVIQNGTEIVHNSAMNQQKNPSRLITQAIQEITDHQPD